MRYLGSTRWLDQKRAEKSERTILIKINKTSRRSCSCHGLSRDYGRLGQWTSTSAHVCKIWTSMRCILAEQEQSVKDCPKQGSLWPVAKRWNRSCWDGSRHAHETWAKKMFWYFALFLVRFFDFVIILLSCVCLITYSKFPHLPYFVSRVFPLICLTSAILQESPSDVRTSFGFGLGEVSRRFFLCFGRIERHHPHNPEPLLGGHSKTGVLHIREIQLLLTADVFGADHSLLGVDMVIFWTRSSLTSGNQQALPLKKQLQKETRTLLRCAFGLVLQNTFAFSKFGETKGNRQNAAPQRLSPECLVRPPSQWWWSSELERIQLASRSLRFHWLTTSDVPPTSIMMCDVCFMMRRNILGSVWCWMVWRASLPRLKTVTSKTSDEPNSSIRSPWRCRLASVALYCAALVGLRLATSAAALDELVLTAWMTSWSVNSSELLDLDSVCLLSSIES